MSGRRRREPLNHNPPIVSLCHHTHVETGGMDQTELTTYSVESLYPPAVPCCPAPVQTRLASWARTFSLPGQCLVILEMMFRLARFLLERLGACSVPTAMRASQGQRKKASPVLQQNYLYMAQLLSVVVQTLVTSRSAPGFMGRTCQTPRSSCV